MYYDGAELILTSKEGKKMQDYICEHCGKKFQRKNKRTVLCFCSQSCCHAWRKGRNSRTQFQLGSTPWNKGLKGIHNSPETEFKKGRRSLSILPVGSVTIRIRKRDGKRRAWVKTANPGTWRPRASVVWEKEHGAIPNRFVIHHMDEDSLNDDIDNLDAMSRSDHLLIHAEELKSKRAAALKKRMATQ